MVLFKKFRATLDKIRDMSRNFGEFFREYRKKSKFSGDDGAIELADILNVSRATIYNWEKSEKVPNRLNWQKLNDVFCENLESIFYNLQVVPNDKSKVYLEILNTVIESMSPNDILSTTNELIMSGKIELAQIFAQLTQKHIALKENKEDITK